MDPKDLRYTKSHEWAHLDGTTVIVGITKFAVELLTDLTHVDLPKVGRSVKAASAFGEVESVKAVSDLYAPVDGEVIEVNAAVAERAELVAEDPYGAGWLVKLRVSAGATLDHLMDLAAYEKQVASEAH